MGSEAMSSEDLKRSLVSLAARAGAELRAKYPAGEAGVAEKVSLEGGGVERKLPHWGDPILCDGLVHAARALGQGALADDAIGWFAPRLASGPRLADWFWLWAAEALPALDLFS